MDIIIRKKRNFIPPIFMIIFFLFTTKFFINFIFIGDQSLFVFIIILISTIPIWIIIGLFVYRLINEFCFSPYKFTITNNQIVGESSFKPELIVPFEDIIEVEKFIGKYSVTFYSIEYLKDEPEPTRIKNCINKSFLNFAEKHKDNRFITDLIILLTEKHNYIGFNSKQYDFMGLKLDEFIDELIIRIDEVKKDNEKVKESINKYEYTISWK